MISVTASKQTSAKIAATYDEWVLHNYPPMPCALARGEGCFVWDVEGRRYLDFTAGIAVNTLGHAHPHWVAEVSRQAGTLAHGSNLFAHPQQARLAQRLGERTGPGHFFFCNSGAEANEALLKLARLYGRRLSGGEEGVRYEVVVARNAFHGRTFGGMSATPQEKIQKGFRPLLPGFSVAEFNSVEAFAAAVTERTAAIFVETIQGEAGIYPARLEFLRGLRKLCDERGLMLMLDEVQCGIGRTGRFFAFEQAGIRPDALGMAKGLGGGFPIGAIWVREGLADLFTPGSHGTTFGGSPLACAAANAVLDVMEERDLLAHVRQVSESFMSRLQAIVDLHRDHLREVRGQGLMLALAVQGDPAPWIARLRENGLLTVRAGTDAIRLLPPLIVTESELAAAAEIIDFVFGTTFPSQT